MILVIVNKYSEFEFDRMEGGYDASDTVGNQNLDTRESLQQEVTNSNPIYHEPQQLQHHQQNQTVADRPTEIPAAKVLYIYTTYLVYLGSIAYIYTIIYSYTYKTYTVC